eukprot:XP_011602021.1 PREDICTED: uncharacterized protein LOC105416418 isoform X2 [Takifugu rubripes]
MTPLKPPRKSYAMKPTITYESLQSLYEDPDALQPAVTDGNQTEVKVRPVPRPRSKLVSKPEVTSHNDADAADAGHSSSSVDSHFYEYPVDYKRLRPVRPPPKPPVSKSVASDKPSAGEGGGNSSVSLNSEESPAITTDGTHSTPPPRPPRPPLSPTYCNTEPTTRRKSETLSGDSERSGSPWIGCNDGAAEHADKPVVPPRYFSLSRRASESDVSPAQTRPPQPPTPPPKGEQSTFSEAVYRPYLHILPEDNHHVLTNGRCAPRLGQHPRDSPQNETKLNTEEINMMLRWLRRVSKSDSLAPSLYGLSIEEEIRSFQQRAADLRKALRLYSLLMMKRSESLRDILAEFSSISSSLDKMQKKTKTMGIAGGTTGAVGGVTAVLGIALAPVTMGTSLIATAVGAGMMASAGGMGAHTAKQAKKKNVTRTAVEKLVDDYKLTIVDLEYCLDFILSVMSELRRHDLPRLQRSGVETEALKLAHLSQSVMSSRNNFRKGSASGMSSERLLQVFAKELDQYFTENQGQKLKKSCRSKFSGRVRLLAENLQDELDHLNCMWEMFS